jgi:uridine kinase
MLRSQLLEALSNYILEKTRDHPIRVAIDGLDNAGKSKLAKELIFPLKKCKRQIINISIDGFHHPKKYRYRRGEYSPEGYYYDSFNLESIISNVLEPLSPGGNRQFRKQVFDFTTDQVVESDWEIAEDHAILLFDGLFLQRQELDPFWDIRIFIDIEQDVSLERAFKRDLHYYHSLENIHKKYILRVFPAHQIYLERCHPLQHADVIIENNDWQKPTLTFQREIAG